MARPRLTLTMILLASAATALSPRAWATSPPTSPPSSPPSSSPATTPATTPALTTTSAPAPALNLTTPRQALASTLRAYRAGDMKAVQEALFFATPQEVKAFVVRVGPDLAQMALYHAAVEKLGPPVRELMEEQAEASDQIETLRKQIETMDLAQTGDQATLTLKKVPATAAATEKGEATEKMPTTIHLHKTARGWQIPATLFFEVPEARELQALEAGNAAATRLFDHFTQQVKKGEVSTLKDFREKLQQVIGQMLDPDSPPLSPPPSSPATHG